MLPQRRGSIANSASVAGHTGFIGYSASPTKRIDADCLNLHPWTLLRCSVRMVETTILAHHRGRLDNGGWMCLPKTLSGMTRG
jgi:hypothetical protein